ncbi:maleylpyruvate isomerase family mycothiol-dependent enzyme [Kineococcus sp. TBRC 1896]|uniref:Maleylpyruvate isomerase family mycothiol-dependent enzyme n=1 Tax=Kineococcus mangrovi TaxID=1660183 RepID=A0ABV4I413_9ACTN
MDVFAEIAVERRALADELTSLTPQQRSTQSLCSAWTVHDVLAHLVMPLEVSLPRVVLAVLVAGGNFDRANQRVTRTLARRPFGELCRALREGADSRFTPPGAGPQAPLVDVLVHRADIRRPLGLRHEIPAPRARSALEFLVTSPSGLVPRGALSGLRLTAQDVGFAHGDGPEVSGPVDALLLAVTGRTAGLEDLTGEGVDLLRARIA